MPEAHEAAEPSQVHAGPALKAGEDSPSVYVAHAGKHRRIAERLRIAAQLLEAGLADNKPVREAGSSDRQKYMREHLALAVCYEMLGRDEEAREQYVLANDCKSDSRAQEGARRCAEKLGL